MYLLYVNPVGPNYKGKVIYEFIFGDEKEAWGENWDSSPAGSSPLVPDSEYITRVGYLSSSDLCFEMVQKSFYFDMSDAIDGVVAICWELGGGNNSNRLFFHFGEKIESVDGKLYLRNLELEYAV